MKKLFAVLMCFVVLSSVAYAVEDAEMEVVEDVPEEVVDTAPFDETGSLVDILPSVADKASETVADGELTAEVSSGGNTFYVLTDPGSSDDETYTPAPSIDDPDSVITDIAVLTSVAPVTPSDATGLKAALLGILGNYDPVIVEYQYSNSQGYNNYLREVQPDYVWLCSCALLALVIYCLFKLGGGLLRG